MTVWTYGLWLGCANSVELMVSSTHSGEEDYDGGSMGEPTAPSEQDNDDGFGSEQEEDSLALRPATTESYVFVANPSLNTVTRISVPSLAVITVEVGVNPTLVETSSDYTKAVTFNQGANSLSVIDAETLEVLDIDIRSNLNQMRMSPDGRWVICYHDLSVDSDDVAQGAAISYNAISIVDLQEEKHFEAMAGSHPHDVQFTENSDTAIIISNDYLSVIDLTEQTPSLERIAIADDLINPPKAEEVLLDPDGNYVLIRQYGVDELVLVNLQTSTNQVSMIAVGANPTDMDVSLDGTQALVVSRGDQQIWVYDLSDPTLSPSVFDLPEEEVFGSLLLSPDGEQGLVYSTASELSRLGVWNLQTDEVVVRGLIKPVSSVEISSNGETAILFHPQTNGDTPTSSYYYNRYAMSLIDLNDYFSTSVQLSGEPDSFTSIAAENMGVYTMRGQSYLEMVDYDTFVPREIVLPSTPIHLGTLPDSSMAFVSQEHELGRISFLNTQTDDLQTVTGFELNSAIED